MTVQEMSELFDLLSNTYQRGADYGKADFLAFDEYEKSVYLTLGQQAYVIACYSGRNESGYQFEVTEEDRRMLDSLMSTARPNEYSGTQRLDHIVEGSKLYVLPDELMFIVYEQVTFDEDEKCFDGKNAVVVPVTHDEFWKVYNNPFRNSNQRRVLRLDSYDNIVELVSQNNIGSYTVRYLKKPQPIILCDMPEESDLTVFNGEHTEQACLLDDTIQPKIVEIAVNMALQRRSIGNTK